MVRPDVSRRCLILCGARLSHYTLFVPPPCSFCANFYVASITTEVNTVSCGLLFLPAGSILLLPLFYNIACRPGKLLVVNPT
jgi:hypothetical protein